VIEIKKIHLRKSKLTNWNVNLVLIFVFFIQNCDANVYTSCNLEQLIYKLVKHACLLCIDDIYSIRFNLSRV
jgi:hypothetical protein